MIHGDGNDWNALVDGPRAEPHSVVSVIDFGDMHHGLLVAEPAVAAAYALLGADDPLAADAAVVGGYHAARPLEEEEVALLFALITARLAVSVVVSATRKKAVPDDHYVIVSGAPAWAALERFDRVHPRFAHYRFREACGLPPVPHGPAVVSFLERASPASVLEADLRTAPCLVLDLGVGGNSVKKNLRERGAVVCANCS